MILWDDSADIKQQSVLDGEYKKELKRNLSKALSEFQ